MSFYTSKTKSFSGSEYREVSKKAIAVYQKIKKKTKRRPYVRSAYFSKSKIFLELFWQHLWAKENFRDKTRRLRYFACAIELIEQSKFPPVSKSNPNSSGEFLHRFKGVTTAGEVFFVQIKEYRKTGEKWLMSIFPEE
jgi:hypothetical protein